jgi:hypothetical protein
MNRSESAGSHMPERDSAHSQFASPSNIPS